MTTPLAYDDDYIRGILRRTRVIAMPGASTSWNRPSFFVMKYLQRKGYRVIPVNPRAVGQEILGEPVVGSLGDIGSPVDMVDIFRNSKQPDRSPTKPSRSARKRSGCRSASATTTPPSGQRTRASTW